jgi:xanthine dehydrogenase YagR molybdenum-binding subunit
MTRVEGIDKVTGRARYAAEVPMPDLAYGWVVQSHIGRGRIAAIDVDGGLAMPGTLAILHHGNAPRLVRGDDGNVLVLQDDVVPYRGSIVALVVATTLEHARETAKPTSCGSVS